MATTYIVDKDGNRLMLQLLPFHQTALFVVHGHFVSGTVISEDMTKQKKSSRIKSVRFVSHCLLQKDVVYMKALEADDTSAKAASVTKKAAHCVMHQPLLQLVVLRHCSIEGSLGYKRTWR